MHEIIIESPIAVVLLGAVILAIIYHIVMYFYNRDELLIHYLLYLFFTGVFVLQRTRFIYYWTNPEIEKTIYDYLNEPFQIRGTVIHGNKLGRTIGFPTANLAIDDSLKLIPCNGVYGVEVILENGKKHIGMMNIGVRPTIDESTTTHIEVHLFDFTQQIYDQKIRVSLVVRVRDEQKFIHVEALQNQLAQDEIFVRTFFSI